jgi:hypothetical protein
LCRLSKDLPVSKDDRQKVILDYVSSSISELIFNILIDAKLVDNSKNDKDNIKQEDLFNDNLKEKNNLVDQSEKNSELKKLEIDLIENSNDGSQKEDDGKINENYPSPMESVGDGNENEIHDEEKKEENELEEEEPEEEEEEDQFDDTPNIPIVPKAKTKSISTSLTPSKPNTTLLAPSNDNKRIINGDINLSSIISSSSQKQLFSQSQFSSSSVDNMLKSNIASAFSLDVSKISNDISPFVTLFLNAPSSESSSPHHSKLKFIQTLISTVLMFFVDIGSLDIFFSKLGYIFFNLSPIIKELEKEVKSNVVVIENADD